MSKSLACFPTKWDQHARQTRSAPSPACGQGNRICVNKTGISLLLDSVRSVNDSYLFTHMRLPCPLQGEGAHRVRRTIMHPTHHNTLYTPISRRQCLYIARMAASEIRVSVVPACVSGASL